MVRTLKMYAYALHLLQNVEELAKVYSLCCETKCCPLKPTFVENFGSLRLVLELLIQALQFVEQFCDHTRLPVYLLLCPLFLSKYGVLSAPHRVNGEHIP